ncbi:hypothetical protein V8E53_002611 [Lactarius tabidus]
MSGSKPGSAAYLGCYRGAMKNIAEGLDEETQQKYKAQAKKWTEQKPPPRQQQWTFQKNGNSVLWEFSKLMYHQYRVCIAILAGYCDAEGEPAITFHDINNELGGTLFKAHYRDWANEPMVNNSQNGLLSLLVKGNASLPLLGWTPIKWFPILPTWEAIKSEGLPYRKSLIRIAAGGSRGRVPWSQLQESRGEYINPKYLLEGITLAQFHHIHLKDINSLLQHWMQRQASREIPFRFVTKADWHGPRVQSELELQDDHVEQGREGGTERAKEMPRAGHWKELNDKAKIQAT